MEASDVSAVGSAPVESGNGGRALGGPYEEAVKCSRCGFCQPVCPVYQATAREAHVARGKNVLFRKVVEGSIPVEADLREAFDNCLLCRACTSSCFPGVRTDAVVIAFREAYAERRGEPLAQRLMFRNVLPHPRRSALLFHAALTALSVPYLGGAQGMGIVRMLNPKLDMARQLVPRGPRSFLRERLKAASLHPRRPRLRVGYWVSCGYNYLLPEAGLATTRVLVALGAEVVPLPNSCCGLPVLGYGDRDAARGLARLNLRRLSAAGPFDFIVSECGSCSSHLKEYSSLLANDDAFRKTAVDFSARVRSFSELVVELGVNLPLQDYGKRVTYHDPCHMTSRYQGVTEQPRLLLNGVPGLDFIELQEADTCCGAAGSYSVMHSAVSSRILERKMRNIVASSADVVVTECPSCLLQLSLGARRHAPQVAALGVSQVLASAMRL